MNEGNRILVSCSHCGRQPRNHDVVAKYDKSESSPDGSITIWTSFIVCKCLGCETIRFVTSTACSEDCDPETGVPSEDIVLWGRAHTGDRDPIPTAGFPAGVQRIYGEAVTAMNSGCPILSAAGIRAIVEAICIDQDVQGRTLQVRIEGLVGRGLLARSQAEFLHEARYLGNTALHEIQPPHRESLADGLDILEGLLNTIYVLPVKAQRMRDRRENNGGESPIPDLG